MSTSAPQYVWVQGLPVCFPQRPCADYSPYEADVINLTTSLTPASQAIAIAIFVVAGVGLVLIAIGLQQTPRHPTPGPWSVVVSTALLVIGAVVASVVDLRSSAILAAYGLQGSAGPDFYGSWWLVSLAGEAMAAAGLAALVTIALVAIVRLRIGAPNSRTTTP